MALSAGQDHDPDRNQEPDTQMTEPPRCSTTFTIFKCSILQTPSTLAPSIKRELRDIIIFLGDYMCLLKRGNEKKKKTLKRGNDYHRGRHEGISKRRDNETKNLAYLEIGEE